MTDRIAHLDGLRAFSVVLVVLFHAAVPFAGGGFLGVSVFFTLSGYLLTDRLLRVEPTWASVRSYWSARWRRILPAALAVLVLVTAYEWARGIADGGPRRIWLTALGLSNWMQIADGSDYAQLFAAPDMLLHYWSLAVEEQVYLVLPLVLFIALRRSRRAAGAVLTVLLVLSFAAPVVLDMSVARTYYGTDTRAGEIIAGGLLALLHSREVPSAHRTLHRLAHAGGIAGLAGLLVLAATATPDSDFITAGLLPLTTLLSLSVLHAARRATRLAGGLFELRPVAGLGRLSYGIYLLHWPILVVLGEAGLPSGVAAVGGLTLSAALAWPLDRWVEQPIRHGSGPRLRLLAGSAAATALAALSIAIPAGGGSDEFLKRLEQGGEVLREQEGDDDPTPVSVTATPDSTAAAPPSTVDAPTTTASPVPASLGIVGDSLALSVALVLSYQVPHEVVPLETISTKLGCGMLLSLPQPACTDVVDRWSADLAASPVDVVLVVSCQWELVARDLPGIGARHVGQPEMDETIRSDYRTAVQILRASGAKKVAWATCGELSPTVGYPTDPEYQASRDPARVAALNALIYELAEELDGEMVVVDLAAWVDARRDDAAIRPDGSHFEWEAPTPLADELVRLLSPILTAPRNG